MSVRGIVAWVCSFLLVGVRMGTGQTPPLTILALAIIVSYNIRAMPGGD